MGNDQLDINYEMGCRPAPRVRRYDSDPNTPGILTVEGSGNTIHTSAGSALTVINTTIGDGDLTFQSITASGGRNGIELRNTGSSGHLAVTGTGTAGSGGSITGSTGADVATHACADLGSTIPAGVGVYLNTTSAPSFAYMTFPGTFGNFGILGYSVNGFTLDHTTMTGTYGDNASEDEDTVGFCGLTGSASITNDTISNGASDNVYVNNYTGSLNRLTMANDTIGLNQTNGNIGTLIEGNTPGNPTINTTVEDSTFQGSRGTPVAFVGQDGSTMDIVFGQPGHGNTVHNTHGNVAPGTENFDASGGSMTFDINSNHFDTPNTSNTQGGVFINSADHLGNMSGYFRNNTIGNSGVTNSGSDGQANALDIESNDGGNLTIDLDSNQIFQFNGAIGTGGVYLEPHGATTLASAPTIFNVTFTNNTVAQQGTSNGVGQLEGVQLNNETQTGDATIPGGEAFLTCLKFQGNTVNGSDAGNSGGGVRLRQRFNTVVEMPGYTGPQDGSSGSPTVPQFIQGLNPTGPPSVTSVSSTAGDGGFFNTPGGAACALPGF